MIFNDPLLNLTVPEGPRFSGQDGMETSYRNESWVFGHLAISHLKQSGLAPS